MEPTSKRCEPSGIPLDTGNRRKSQKDLILLEMTLRGGGVTTERIRGLRGTLQRSGKDVRKELGRDVSRVQFCVFGFSLRPHNSPSTKPTPKSIPPNC